MDILATDWVDIITKSIGSLALIIGACIALWKWGWLRPKHTRANLAHKVFAAPLNNEYNILNVTLEIQNKGSTCLYLDTIRTEIRKVSPVDAEVKKVLDNNIMSTNKSQIAWPVFTERKYDGKKLEQWIDSSETEYIYFDFILPKVQKVVSIWTELILKTDPDIRWHYTTMVNVDDLMAKNTAGEKPEKP